MSTKSRVVSYTKELRLPMMFYTAAVNGVFAFLIAGGLLFTTHGVTPDVSAEPAVLYHHHAGDLPDFDPYNVHE